MADPQSNAALPALPEDAPRAGVLHVRHRHTDRFTVVGNHLAQHKSLSATAIGLAVHIQSLPDGASVTAKALTLRFPEGETTIRRALNELEEAGYLERRLVPLGGGRIATRTISYEKPGCVPVAPAIPVTEDRAPTPPPPLHPLRRRPASPSSCLPGCAASTRACCSPYATYTASRPPWTTGSRVTPPPLRSPAPSPRTSRPSPSTTRRASWNTA
ncbi:helix-turn-helix domain-containing protein [Streptomyces sp. SLBN-118]|uniref:helix-turn-helix domain-containing protein n=1 Tax=Streptomyces sp. SLBN-118 TaxID=2768454 RepID=UPI0021B21793|nr:helix-turn-helix domain-containing protein [Streptomyces sp. SLBN-118]